MNNSTNENIEEYTRLCKKTQKLFQKKKIRSRILGMNHGSNTREFIKTIANDKKESRQNQQVFIPKNKTKT